MRNLWILRWTSLRRSEWNRLRERDRVALQRLRSGVLHRGWLHDINQRGSEVTPKQLAEFTFGISAITLNTVDEILKRRGQPELTEAEYRECGEAVGTVMKQGLEAVATAS